MVRKITPINRYAATLLLRVVEVDADKRNIGYSYLKILAKIKNKFPTITYGGPHKGKPIRMTIKDLHKIAVSINQNDPTARLPVRPRPRKRRPKRAKSAA